MKNKLLEAIHKSIADNWNLPALSDFKGTTFNYSDVASRIARIHLLLKASGIKEGDRVALCARNSASWAVTFLGALSYGAIPVPLLHEFHPDQIEHLTTHSESRILFTEKQIFENLDIERLPTLEGVIFLDDFNVPFARTPQLTKAAADMDATFAKAFPGDFTPGELRFADPEPERLAMINYTSGSSGNPKGVMLSYRNLWANVSFAFSRIAFYKPGDTMLSMLPLAHMYGLVFEFLFPFCEGCHITFLGRVPSPAVVLQAFAQTRPKMVITVPLVIEKIVKSRVLPELNKPLMKVLTGIPGIRQIIFRTIRKKLIDAFGGNLLQLIMGGAPVADEVEKVLREIKFPFTIGYGMTECAPLITYDWWADQRPHSVGHLVDGMQSRLRTEGRPDGEGVLQVKGPNVMLGYYRNPKASAEVLTKDGWLDTGDICSIDRDGYIYVRGRDKNMILGPSGQNIYPEEIEQHLNQLPLVGESIVVERDGKLVALVHPDYDLARTQGLSQEQADQRVEALLPQLNSLLPAYSRISKIEIHSMEFEKTPKHSIRRFIYK